MTARSEIESRLAALNQQWLQYAQRGDFASAWRISDEASAVRACIDCRHWPRHQQFIWRGGSIRGRRVLVRCYHGLGDTLQFVRFLPHLRAIAKEVILWVQAPLIPLVETVENGAHRVLALHDGTPAVEFDVDIELAELMHILRVTPDVLERDKFPYLLPNEPRAPRRPGPLRVGLVWRTGEWNGVRSVACELLRPLGAVHGVDWWLFQRGGALAEWRNDFGRAPHIEGMLDEARAMLDLDLLISVDTCSAHLAGALSVPVWTLLPYHADWRWMRERSDSPWYPTMRLFRQSVDGDWSGVIEGVVLQLQHRLANPDGVGDLGNSQSTRTSIQLARPGNRCC